MNAPILSPAIPYLQAMAVLILAVVASIWLYIGKTAEKRKRLMLTILRGGTIALIAFLLFNPTQVRSTNNSPSKPPLLVLLDTTRSMAVADVGGLTRFAAAKKATVENVDLLDRLTRTYQLSFFSLSGDAAVETQQGLEKMEKPTGGRTWIGESLAHALSAIGSKSGGAVLILSDGRNNGEISPIEIARQAKARQIPIFTVCLGQKTTVKDVAVSVHHALVYGAPAQQVELSAAVESSGYGSGLVTVDLLRNGTKTASKQVQLVDGGSTSVSFTAQEASQGQYRYTIASQPLPGEVTATNNKASVLLKIAKTNSRVLVLEARPSWDAKFLIQALSGDPTIVVDSIFKLAQDRYFAVKAAEPDADPALSVHVKVPTTKAEFAKYDVVIIGKGFEDMFNENAARELDAYVQAGGNVIFLRGKAYEGNSILAAMEPIAWSDEEVRDFRMNVTGDGASNPAFGFQSVKDPQTVLQTLPSLISATRVSNEKALSVVLARGTGTTDSKDPNREMAVLAYQNYGGGLVMSLIGEGLWRWALLPPQLADYGQCYNDFWVQIIRWMVSQSDFLPGQNLSLRTDHSIYSPGEAVNLMVFERAKGQAPIPPVTITEPDGKTETVALSPATGKQADYIGVYRPKTSGDFLATLPSQQGKSAPIIAPFGVNDRSEEDVNTSADPALMQQIALAGGGSALTTADLATLPERLKKAEAMFRQKIEPQSLWDRWPVLAIILGLLTLEWVPRRRMGMV